MVEEVDQLVDRHGHQVGDRPPAHTHVERLAAQARAAALRADGLARVAGLHHAELDLAPLRVDVGEEVVQSVEVFVAAPQQPFLLGRQRVEGRMDREVELVGVLDELLLPAAHGLAAPAGDGVVVDGAALVGDHQVLVDADHLAVAFAARAGAQRVVEAEQMLRRGLELDAVSLEARREGLLARLGDEAADAVAVGEGPGHGVADAGLRVGVGGHAQTVDHDAELRRVALRSDFGQHLLDQAGCPLRVEAQQTVGEQQRQLLDDPLPRSQHERCGDDGAAPLGLREQLCRHVVHAVAAHLLPRDGREGVARAGEEQLEVVVDFGRRADGRARVARVDLLLDGDGRGDARDDVDVGFVDAAQELPGVGREALDVAALPLGKDRVEGQRRLARTREPRDDDELVVRNLDLDVAQVVDPRPLDVYAVAVFFHGVSRLCRAVAACGYSELPPGSPSSRMLPPALRSFSTSCPASVWRIVSSIVQRLSKRWARTVGCSSLMTRMMSFMAT